MTQRRRPQRTCLGCRQPGDQAELLRFVCSPEGEVLADVKRRLPGRGAWLCSRRSCIDEAVRKNQFDRAFKRPCRPVSADELAGRVADALLERLVNLLGMARKSADFVAGSNAVLEAMARRKPLAVVITAQDISGPIGSKVRSRAETQQIEVIELFDKVELGRILGRAERSVVGLPAGQLADAFLKELRRFQEISGEG
jgi:predicted RNA-binding protein YlxR (DUF448 family)